MYLRWPRNTNKEKTHIQLLVHASRVVKNTDIRGNTRTIAHTCFLRVLGGAGDGCWWVAMGAGAARNSAGGSRKALVT